tara:strand:+ start:1710 stop:4991 length:3282 start_codon:yes stop_codon:yes gene_type:complete
MATIVTRSGKGSPLTNTEVDANFTNLNNDKFETNAQIRAAVEGASDSNVFTDADHTKLNGIATSANNYSHPTGNGNNHIPSNGSSGQILGYASAGTAQWQASPSSDLVDDTSPQLGGNLASNGSDVLFADNDKAIFGAGSDLQIYHDGSNSYIKEDGTGVLKIQAADLELLHADGSRGIRVTNDGGPVLYNDGSSKLTVNSGGVAISGNITVTGTVDGRDVATDGSKLDGIAVGANVGISDLVDDTSPQLGGTLQTNGNSISAVTNGDVVLVANGTGSNGFVKIKNYFGNEVLRIASGGQIGLQGGANYGTSGQFLKSLGSNAGPTWASISAIGSLVEDTTPQLGGDLDLNGRTIESSGTAGSLTFGTPNNVDSLKLSYTSAGDSEIFGNKIVAKANTSFRVLNNSGTERFKLDTSTGNLTLSGTVDGRDIAANLPASLGSAGQFLKVSSGGAATEWTAAPSPDTFSDNKQYGSFPTTAGSDSFTIGVSATCAGANSLTLGNSATCAGASSASIGKFAAAGGQQSASIGYNASAAGDSTLAIGYGSAVASNSAFGTAVGYEAEVAASSFQAVALGRSYVSGSYATSINIGDHSSNYGALASKAIAIGYQAKASHTNAISIGATVESTNSDQLNLGSTGHTVRISESYTLPTSDGSANQVLTTNGSGAVSFASVSGGASASADLYIANPSSATSPTASGTNAVAIGSDSQATAQDSLGLGTSTRVLGQGSVAIGIGDASYGVLSGADYSIAIGKQARVRANVDYSIAIGYSTDVNNTTSTAIGYNASAFGVGSLGVGLDAYAGNDYALALGKGSYAGNGYSSAIGANSSTQGSTTAANGAMALGGSYASGTDSLAAAIATNSSSYGAKNQYSIAMGRNSKASGNYATGIGYNVTASGSVSIAMGDRAQATGSGSICLAAGGTGWGASATGASSVTIGDGAIARGRGKFSFASGNTAVGSSMMQSGQLTISLVTTNNTPAGLNSWNYGAAGADNQLLLPNNSAFAFHGTIVARQKASEGTACAAWRIEGLIRKEGSAGTTVLVNSATTVLDNTPSWGMALSADTSNGALKVQATGASSTNIRWTGTLYTSEVTYA